MSDMTIPRLLNRSPTIGQCLDGRRNNFGLIRLVAATLVVFSHSFPLTGHIDAEPLGQIARILDFGAVAVITFFVLSGFLIAKSASTSTLVAFARARFLRVWRGLVLTAFVTAFVLGPVATTLTLRRYFLDPDTWRYALGIPLLDVGRFLPGAFLTNPLPMGVNGSLWTIQVEAWLYAIVGCLVLTGVSRRKVATNVFLLAAVVAYVFLPERISEWVPHYEEFMSLMLVGSFMLGMALFVNAPFIPLSPWLLIVLIAAAAVSADTAYFRLLFYPCFAYCVIFIALHPSLYMSKWNDRIDLSYGIYVFAFPIQQTVASLLGPIDPFVFLAICFPIIVIVAAGSWFFVESKALALKRRRLMAPKKCKAMV